MSHTYISLPQAREIHKKTIEKSGGGSLTHKDLNQLDSVLKHIQNDDYYPEFYDKITHLFFGVCKFHCFTDGNKRLAITLSLQFLLLNGYLATAQTFMVDTEFISYNVASGKINKDLLLEIMIALIDDNYENNESLRLKIYKAININDEH